MNLNQQSICNKVFAVPIFRKPTAEKTTDMPVEQWKENTDYILRVGNRKVLEFPSHHKCCTNSFTKQNLFFKWGLPVSLKDQSHEKFTYLKLQSQQNVFFFLYQNQQLWKVIPYYVSKYVENIENSMRKIHFAQKFNRFSKI